MVRWFSGCAARRWPTVAAPIIVLLLAGCVSPAIDHEGYLGKVHQSATKMEGIIGVAQLTGQLDLQNKLLDSFSDTLITDAEQDAQSVVTSLGSVQPPDEPSTALRDNANSVLQDASDQISDLRIAQRRGDVHGMKQALHQLDTTLSEVQKLQDAQ
jgi:hypothetical protein